VLSVCKPSGKGGSPGLSNHQRPARISAGWLTCSLLLSLAAWVVFIRPVVPLDFNVFLSGGLAVAHGHDPYPALASPEVWSGSAFVYPWITAWLFAPAAAVSPHAAVLVMATASIACVVGGVWLVAGRRFGPVVCVLLASPTIVGLQMGTLNAVLFLGVCSAWRWRNHPARVGFAVGLLITLKILCWPLVGWLLLTRRWRATGWAVSAASLMLGIGWVAGPLGPVSYGQLLRELAKHETVQSSGLQGLLVLWWTPVVAAELIGLLAVAGLVVVVARRGDLTIYTAMIAATLFASPVVWHHYYLLAAAPLLLVRGGPQWYFLIGWASVAPHTSYGLSWLPVTVSADVALAACAIALVWRHRATLSTHCRRVPPLVWVACAVAATCLATAAIRVEANLLARGVSQAAVLVSATVALIVAASVDDAHRDQGEPGHESAKMRRGTYRGKATTGLSQAEFPQAEDS
jgi:alpha-1,2-mannosyltransferase